MNNLTAIRQAYAVYLAHDTFDRQGLMDSAVALCEWKLFSNRHVAAFTGLHPSFVAEISGKTDRTGGRLNQEALPLIAKLIQAPLPDSALIVATLDAGVSAHLLARLTGLSQSTLSRKARAHRAAQC